MYTVLIVEDNEVFHEIIQQKLSPENSDVFLFELSYCSEYKDIKEILSKKKIDIVLLDLKLPDIEWTDTIKCFKEDFPNQTFCIMSSLSSKSYAIYALQQGAQDYFMKHDRNINIKQRLVFAAARGSYKTNI